MSTEDISRLQAANLFGVNGLNVVITGGGSGLGAYMARALAINGASKIFIVGRREEALTRTKSSLPEQYAKSIIPILGDVSSKSSLASVREAITGKHGTNEIDVLFCNSGISGPSVATSDPQTKKPYDSVNGLAEAMLTPDERDITNTYHVNITGIHLTVATFLPLLGAANKARPSPSANVPFKPRPQIITTSSIGGYNRVPLGNMSYGPSKAAVVHLTKQLATVLVPYDIRANTIAPGLYLSEMTEGTMKAQGKAEKHNVEGTWGKDTIPATRSGDEEDLAGVVLFLCSRAGAYVNGNVLVTDGGRLAVMPASY
ncbi:hypothetical protein LTR05_004673 [Lithohypha guttulata]|uniref:Uncharacterized protein n=1 Tax=Lithohypha guttulata TaxID=1690604 RepID=A0AAN7SYT9_9EURO|nr:hypothetical protein LTR05_004673 [Lithohypha guttulata]